ncbi:MAG: tetratricopeptide repeat protein [Acidobacteria bacterium]|nr:MAG: tetratricopeptide repeat protein [Acidobacteriota bacterium]
MGRKRQVQRKPGWWNSPVIWAVLLSLLAFVSYANTLGHGFVIDDASLISQSSVVQQLRWGDMLSPAHGYRPVRTFTYGLNFLLGGDDPFGYHLFNVILHSINVVLLFFLFLRWTDALVVSSAGALFFAIHPVQTAAVAYISGRKDILATLFVVLACHAYTSYRRKAKPRLAVLALVLFVLAILAKEVAVVLPALLILVDALLLRPRSGSEGDGRSFIGKLIDSLRQAPLFYGAALLLLLSGAYYAIFIIKASRMTVFWGGSPWVHYGTSFKLFLHYARLVVVPYPLIADYTGDVFRLSQGFFELFTVVCVVFLVGYLFLAVSLHNRNPRITLGMLWFFVALLPVLQIVPFHELAADHFLYLPLVGFVLLLGEAAHFLKRSWGTGPALAGTVALAVCFTILTTGRNRDWKDPATLWSATYRTAPGSYRANQNLGLFYYEKGDTDKAILHTERSIQLDSSKEQAWSNLGALYRARGSEEREAGHLDQARSWNEKALEYLKHATEMEPSDLWAWANMGQVYRDLGLLAEQRGDVRGSLALRVQAFQSYQKALSIGSDHPRFALIWFEEAKVFLDGGYYDQAIYYLRNAEAAFPRHPGILYALGLCYFNLRQWRDSIPYLEKAIQADPSIESWAMLAKCYEELGENYSAIQVYERALSQYPNSVEIHYNLGVLYHRIGDPDRAVRHLEHALQLAPKGPLAGNIQKMLDVIEG